jgi:protein-S-isoprenylcysteine O-methyltransferase Ste14
MKDEKHLPVYGPGPAICAGMIALTVVAVLMRNMDLISAGKMTGSVRTLLLAAGILCILAGAALWIYAVKISKIDDGIINNRLVTSGAYALVRNPIYSAFMIVCTGVLLAAGNLYLLVLPFVYWGYMTAVLKRTEEKWLKDLYGKEYEDYCKRVNRCWPGIPEK